MPWKRMAVHEQRMQFVIRAVSEKEPMAALCREFGVSRPTGYLWRSRYQQVGSLTALAERSRRPHHSPTRTAAAIAARVVAVREQTGWGAKKLHVVLRDEQSLAIPVRTIHRLLERHGLIAEEAHGPALRRFQRSAPNQLWQMDSKGKYPLRDGECHPLSILDDHSRYAVGLYALGKLSTAHAYLVQTFRGYGVPEAMLMDHGTLWWSPHNGWGLTRLSVWLIEQGIRLLYGRVAHPQTQGKVERFHRTLGAALRHGGVPQRLAEWPAVLAEFRHSYNQRRPHEALGMQRPAERYQPSPRPYQERVRAWDYPAGSAVRRLNVSGLLAMKGRRWFVCEALAGQRVRVEEFDGKLLVSYRHMYIREIDLQRYTSQPLVVTRCDSVSPAPVALRAPCAGETEKTETTTEQKV